MFDNAGNGAYFGFSVTIVGDVTGLASPTHPNPDAWYSNNTPGFAWDLQSAGGPGPSSLMSRNFATGAEYSYSFDQNPDGTPDMLPDPVASTGVLSRYNSYEMGSDPRGVASGDLNGDGYADLVTSNRDDNTISVRLNDGSGGFDTGEGAATYGVGSSPGGVALADFNGDGNLDIAVVNSDDHNLYVLLGNGDGTFQEPTIYDTGFDYPYAITTGDFNGDGRPDIAVASWDDAQGFSTLINQGSGYEQSEGFAAAHFWSMDSVWSEGGIASADVNGDGRDDIVVSAWDGDTGNGGVMVAYNDGTGAFPSENQDFLDTNTYPAAVTVGDFNGDNKPDIAAADSDSNDLRVLYNSGDGGFDTENSTTLYQYSSDTYALTAADVNGDGLLDLVTSESDNGMVSVWLQGEGFGERQDFTADSSGYGIAAADFNHDGKADVATGNWDSGVSVLLGGSPANVVEGPVDDGTYYFHVRTIASDAGGNTSSMQVNIDTHAPEVGAKGLEDGGTYRGAQVADIVASDEFSGVASIDWRFAGEDWTNVEDSGASVHIPADPGTYEVGYRATDNAGNVSDVSTFTVTIQSAEAPVIDITNLTSPTHPDPAKWYSNPMPQFAWDTTLGAQFAYSIDQDSEGDPGTATMTVQPLGLFSNMTPYQMGIFGLGVGVGDFNGDGHLDVAVADYGGGDATGAVDVLLNDGHGGFDPSRSIVCPVAGEPMSVAVADMNGDGNPDIVVGLQQSSKVAVLYGDGNGGFGEPQYIDAMPIPRTSWSATSTVTGSPTSPPAGSSSTPRARRSRSSPRATESGRRRRSPHRP